MGTQRAPRRTTRPPAGELTNGRDPKSDHGRAWIVLSTTLLLGTIASVRPAPRRVSEPQAPRTLPAAYEPPPPSTSLPRVASALATKRAEPPLHASTQEGARERSTTTQASEPPGAPALATLVALLVDADSGTPIPGATLELGLTPRGAEDEAVRVLTANSEGRVRVELEPGEARLVGWKNELTGGPLFVTLEAGVTSPATIALEPAHRVLGRVVDAHTGAPIDGARITFWTFSERDTVQTGADGNFSHPRFPSTEYREQIRVEAPGYGATVRYLAIDRNGSWELPDPVDGRRDASGRSVPWVAISLVPELVVLGRVVDEHGAPLAGATVSAEGYVRVLPDVASRDAATATTDEDGHFELGGLRSDVSHSLLVTSPGHAALELELGAGSTLVDVGALRLERELLLAGSIVDAEGFPAADLRVTLTRLDVESEDEPPSWETGAQELDVPARFQGRTLDTRSSADGTFVFEHLRPAAYAVEVWRGERSLVSSIVTPPATAPSSGSPGASSSQSPWSSIELALPLDALTLRGLVSMPGGERLPEDANLTVEVIGGDATTQLTPDEHGHFRAAGLRADVPYRIVARALHGERTLSAELEAWAFEEPEIVLRERSAGWLVDSVR